MLILKVAGAAAVQVGIQKASEEGDVQGTHLVPAWSSSGLLLFIDDDGDVAVRWGWAGVGH